MLVRPTYKGLRVASSKQLTRTDDRQRQLTSMVDDSQCKTKAFSLTANRDLNLANNHVNLEADPFLSSL